jgi:hypothetical protein
MRKLAVVALMLAFAPAAWGYVAINECDYDNPGTDSTEWVELTGRAGTDLTNWTLVHLNQTGALQWSYTLTGTIPNEFASPWGGYGGFFVIGIFDATTEAAFPGQCDYTPPGWTTNMIQQGPDDILQLYDDQGTLMDEWEYKDSDSISVTGLSQPFTAYDSAGTAGDITTYSSIGRIGYSYDLPLFVFDDPKAQLGVQSVDDRYDHQINNPWSGTGPAWTAPGYTGSLFSTVGPYTEAGDTPEIQWSGTSSYGANRGLSPGTFNNASYGAGGQDPYTINIVPEPATLALLALGGLALFRRR